jgi:membrane protein YqaA with SNARE-associated domain
MKLENKKLKKSQIELLILIGVFLIITLILIFFRNETRKIIEILVAQFGLPGLFVITYIMDTLIQPISPDMLTFGYSMTELNVLIVTLVGGIASVLAGFTGYGIGNFIGKKGIDKFIGQKRYGQAHNLFVKHGFWAVLIGAMSPVPFGAMCWSAGVFKMPWKFFCVSVIITRLPRFLMAGYIGTLFI